MPDMLYQEKNICFTIHLFPDYSALILDQSVTCILHLLRGLKCNLINYYLAGD